MKSQPSPAVATAKERSERNGNERIITLHTGDRARINPVSASLVDEVTSHIVDPTPPMVPNPDKPTLEHPEGRLESNPSDPEYLRLMSEANRKRGIAALDAMVMFGVELLDGIPEDDRWLKKLKYMAKRGQVDLSLYDLDDEIDREFLYKRFIAVDNDTITKVSEISGISGEEIDRAERSFPSD